MDAPLRLPVADCWLMCCHIGRNGWTALGAIPERFHKQPHHGHARQAGRGMGLGHMGQSDTPRPQQRLYMVQPVQPAPDDLGAKLQQRICDGLVLHGPKLPDQGREGFPFLGAFAT